jgi:acetyl-CoA carboxylase biotin carboxyl carrier protein
LNNDAHRTVEDLRFLREEATALVNALPGPVRRIAVRNADQAIEIEWATAEVPAASLVAGPATAMAHAAPVLAMVPSPAADEREASHIVRAPLVGTFYRAPQPGAEPFVDVGDVVELGQTLGIVEAMKLMNHIVAEVAGEVVEICVKNGEPVEFDQPLLRIAPFPDEQTA